MLNTIKVIIIDDELASRENLISALNQVSFNIELLGIADNAKKALKLIINYKPELIFLDIELPVNDGFWLADKLRELNISLAIIFVKAFDDYAIKAIKYAAYDYINKPVDINVLNESLLRYMSNRSDNTFMIKTDYLRQFINQGRLKLNTHYGFQLIPLNSILYCKADHNHTSLNLVDGTSKLAFLQLGTLEKQLNNSMFVRISRSIIINIEYLESVNRRSRTVILNNLTQKHKLKSSSSGIKKLALLITL